MYYNYTSKYVIYNLLKPQTLKILIVHEIIYSKNELCFSKFIIENNLNTF